MTSSNTFCDVTVSTGHDLHWIDMSHSFEEMFTRASGFRRISPQLRPLLERIYRGLIRRPVDLAEIRAALEELFLFLSSADGRTDANCTVTDYFFSFAEEWKEEQQNLPASLRELLAGIGGALHDTVHAPSIAENFGCLPEQLLERARNLENDD
jgi:hypothetical protein